MTWAQTHQRWQALQEIEARAAADPSGTLPWSAEYEALFGSPEGLLATLRYRWDNAVQAQLDNRRNEEELAEAEHELQTRFAGVLRILDRHDRLDRLDRGAVHACAS